MVPPLGGVAPPRGGTANFSHPKSANHFSYEMKDAEKWQMFMTSLQAESEVADKNHAIIDSMSDGLIAVDQQCIVTEANLMVCRLFQTHKDHLIGQNLCDLFDMPLFREKMALLTDKRETHVRFELKMPSPGESALSVSGSCLEKAGGYVFLFHDITEEKRTRDMKDEMLGILSEEFKATVDDLTNAHRKLNEAYLDTIHRLALAAEYKDEDTGAHIVRMSQYSALLADKLGLSKSEVRDILYASPMHDVGKIGIPDSILMKPGKLTDKEFDTMKTHTTIGARILANSRSGILRVAQQIAISHHEKWNGKGYPQGLSRDNIPVTGRIVALADAFDALTSKRPYKPPYPVEVVVDIVRKERGEHFDPDMADVFLNHMDEMIRIKIQVNLMENVSLSDFVPSERDTDEI